MNGRLDPRGQGQMQGQDKPQRPAFNWTLVFWIFILYLLFGPWISRQFISKAAILAARKHKDTIDEKDIDEAVDKILMGLERDNIAITPEERKLLAYHEGGTPSLPRYCRTPTPFTR